jgi:hypothetical protein
VFGVVEILDAVHQVEGEMLVRGRGGALVIEDAVARAGDERGVVQSVDRFSKSRWEHGERVEIMVRLFAEGLVMFEGGGMNDSDRFELPSLPVDFVPGSFDGDDELNR